MSGADIYDIPHGWPCSPNVIHPAGYLTPLYVLAWRGAGWASLVGQDGRGEAWGPPSIAPYIAMDVADMTGCIDARL